jgi:DNA-3-methyladenine glycosylase
MKILTHDFFERNTVTVARDLIGKLLVHEVASTRVAGRIVETEAYRGDDPACHAWGNVHPQGGSINPNGRSAALFGSPGTAYVYLNYGMYWLLNVVTEPEGSAGAVLIRAVEPLEGIDFMKERRPAVRREEDLTNGPGKLVLAFGIDGTCHNQSLLEGPLYFGTGPDGSVTGRIGTSSRIGINLGVELMWRFYEAGNPYVSQGKPGKIVRKRKRSRR